MGIYNCEEYLSESIESIIAQTYTNWELIMCDDGSFDKTYEVAQRYAKKYPKKIILLSNKINMGLNYTLNKCIDIASGDYIARQDGDDVSLPERLEIEMEFLLSHPEYSLVSSNMLFFDENGVWGESHNFGEVKKENFIKGSPICHAPCVVKKEALKTVGGYSVADKYLRVEDYHLWFKLFIAGYKSYNLLECLYKMRDDKKAYKRRTIKNRINETRLKIWGFHKIKIPLIKRIWAFKPIILALMPISIYQYLHRKNMLHYKNKIKIAQFVGSMNCGGTETMLVNLFQEFDKNKYEFVFIENVSEKCWYDDEIIKHGGRILKIQNFSFNHIISYVKELKKVFKEEQFDVVHSHVFLHSGIVLYAAKLAGIPIRIAHSHSAMNKSDNNFIKLKLLRNMIFLNATKILACSTEAGICLFGKRFLKEGQVVPNPIQLSNIQNVREQDIQKIKKQYKIDDNCFVIGHVGRLVEVKNHKFMVELANKLNELNFEFKMFFLGDGPLKDEVMSMINDYNLNEKIIMTGNVTHVYDYMNLFNILILPSFYEGLPVTLIEAQASGLFSIVSDKVSKESDLGLGLMAFESIENLNNWVKFIMNFNPENISKKEIYKRINEKKYSSSSAIEEYEQIYKFK